MKEGTCVEQLQHASGLGLPGSAFVRTNYCYLDLHFEETYDKCICMLEVVYTGNGSGCEASAACKSVHQFKSLPFWRVSADLSCRFLHNLLHLTNSDLRRELRITKLHR